MSLLSSSFQFHSQSSVSTGTNSRAMRIQSPWTRRRVTPSKGPRMAAPLGRRSFPSKIRPRSSIKKRHGSTLWRCPNHSVIIGCSSLRLRGRNRATSAAPLLSEIFNFSNPKRNASEKESINNDAAATQNEAMVPY